MESQKILAVYEPLLEPSLYKPYSQGYRSQLARHNSKKKCTFRLVLKDKEDDSSRQQVWTIGKKSGSMSVGAMREFNRQRVQAQQDFFKGYMKDNARIIKVQADQKQREVDEEQLYTQKLKEITQKSTVGGGKSDDPNEFSLSNLHNLKDKYVSLQSNHRMLNTIAKIKNEDYTKQLKKAFAQQSQSIKRMYQGLKEED